MILSCISGHDASCAEGGDIARCDESSVVLKTFVRNVTRLNGADLTSKKKIKSVAFSERSDPDQDAPDCPSHPTQPQTRKLSILLTKSAFERRIEHKKEESNEDILIHPDCFKDSVPFPDVNAYNQAHHQLSVEERTVLFADAALQNFHSPNKTVLLTVKSLSGRLHKHVLSCEKRAFETNLLVSIALGDNGEYILRHLDIYELVRLACLRGITRDGQGHVVYRPFHSPELREFLSAFIQRRKSLSLSVTHLEKLLGPGTFLLFTPENHPQHAPFDICITIGDIPLIGRLDQISPLPNQPDGNRSAFCDTIRSFKEHFPQEIVSEKPH